MSRIQNPIARLVAKRVLFSLAVVMFVLLLVFSLIHLAPGSPEATLAVQNPLGASPERIEQLREQYGLGDPLPVQFLRFVGNVVQLDFGTSYRTNEDVLPMVVERLAVTGPLILLALLFATIVGIGLGVWAAYRRGQAVDRATSSLAIFGASSPEFATGILLLYVFAVLLGVFPVLGAGEGFVDRLWHLTLPALTLAIAGVAGILKLTRAAVVKALEHDSVTFGKARGLAPSEVLRTNVLPNSMVGITTIVGLVAIAYLSGSALVEVTFDLPGVGALLIDAIQRQDIPVIQMITLLVALVTVTINLAVDVLYLALDPRVRARASAEAGQ